MSSQKPISAPLIFLLIIFSIASFKLSYCTGNNSINVCPEIEKQALLSFKQTLEDPSNLLSSWINSDVNCCKWKGIVCNNLTGHVHELHLQSSDGFSGLRGKINPSLLDLKYLRYLDLGQNNFGETIPPFIGSFIGLEHLNLSDAGFHGTIPYTIGNISNLRTLSLESAHQSLDVDNLEWLSRLSQLEHLNMNNVNLSKAAVNWVQVINTLPSLVELHFKSCSLNFIAPLNDVNISSLSILDLSDNEFQSFVVPRWIFQFSELIFLDLRGNYFEGPIPSVSNATKLQHIDLSFNHLNSTIPDWLYFCKDLEFVSLSSNFLHSSVSNAIANLSSLNTLDLSWNELSGKIPREITNLCKMQRLGLYKNKLQGEILDSFGNMSDCFLGALESLHLGENQLSGHLTDQFGGFKSLETLDLGRNLLSGNVPSWFWDIHFLNLSHNQFHGKIPHIRGSRYVYLSSNQFSSSLPRVANTVINLELSNNSFSGGMSHFLCGMTNETYSLEILNLEGNKLTGELPDCWMKWPSLKVLNLGYNNMFGSIPNSIGFLVELRSLNLYSNKFSGQIPFSMHSCTKLAKIDISYNDLNGNIPTWMGTSVPNLIALILRSNKLSGKISPAMCLLNSLQILDLSDNKFSGIIPRCVDNFTAMATKRSLPDHRTDYRRATIFTKGKKFQYDVTLSLVTNIDLSKNNLSGDIPKELTSLVELKSLSLAENQLTGLIPDTIGGMKQLESLDLSKNSLSGEIPNSFASMSFLNYLNLSYNNLTGRIPESTQLLGFDASCFIGNRLCGPPLTSNCSTEEEVPTSVNKEDNERDKPEIEWFYILLSLGYAVGFSVVCTTLILKKSWREAYFGLVENMWDKLHISIYIKWRRFAKR